MAPDLIPALGKGSFWDEIGCTLEFQTLPKRRLGRSVLCIFYGTHVTEHGEFAGSQDVQPAPFRTGWIRPSFGRLRYRQKGFSIVPMHVVLDGWTSILLAKCRFITAGVPVSLVYCPLYYLFCRCGRTWDLSSFDESRFISPSFALTRGLACKGRNSRCLVRSTVTRLMMALKSMSQKIEEEEVRTAFASSECSCEPASAPPRVVCVQFPRPIEAYDKKETVIVGARVCLIYCVIVCGFICEEGCIMAVRGCAGMGWQMVDPHS